MEYLLWSKDKILGFVHYLQTEDLSEIRIKHLKYDKIINRIFLCNLLKVILSATFRNLDIP